MGTTQMQDTGSITLTDDQTDSSVVIAPHRGAIVTSFCVKACELLYLDAATFDDSTKNVRGGIPVLFPSPGKLDDDKFRSNGREGALKQHGFARTLPWTVASEPTPSTATLSLESSEATLTQYPWRFRTELEFVLQARRLRITTRVQNTDDAPMPFGVGFHPYFHVIDKAQARIDTDASLAFNNVTKKTNLFSGFDLTEPEVDLHLLDHRSPSATLHLSDGSTIDVRASPEFALWVVWTLAGKDFVCLEPWTSPANALNNGDRLLTVAPGQTRELWMEIEFTKG
jgi:galactose mutarotase-like enzyme